MGIKRKAPSASPCNKRVTAGIIGIARLLQFLGALLLFGAPPFNLYAMQPKAVLRAWQRPFLLLSAAIALLGALLWSVAETVAMSDEPGDAMQLSAVWLMLTQTRFGLACLLRMAIVLLALSALLSRHVSSRGAQSLRAVTGVDARPSQPRRRGRRGRRVSLIAFLRIDIGYASAHYCERARHARAVKLDRLNLCTRQDSNSRRLG